MPGPDLRFERNEALVRRRLDRELEAGVGFVEERIRHLVPGVGGLLVNPLARLVFHWIGRREVRRRVHDQLDVVVEAARDLRDASLPDVVDRYAEDLLETEEIVVRGDRDHPRFPEVRERLRELHRERIHILGTLLLEGEGATYEELVASVYTRREVDGAVQDQIDAGEALVELVREDPGLLKVPAMVRPYLLEVIDETFDWWRARFRDQLDDIFPASSGDPADAAASAG